MEKIPPHQCVPNSPCESFPTGLIEFDEFVLHGLDVIRNPETMAWVKWLNNGLPSLSMLVLAVLLIWKISSPARIFEAKQLWIQKLPILYGILCLGISDLTSTTIKRWILRIKPFTEVGDLHPRLSFPSNHAFNTTACMALAFVLLSPTIQKKGRFLALAGGFAMFVAFGRVFLKEHYPSDVITGFVLGAMYGVIAGLIGLRIFGHRIDTQSDKEPIQH